MLTITNFSEPSLWSTLEIHFNIGISTETEIEARNKVKANERKICFILKFFFLLWFVRSTRSFVCLFIYWAFCEQALPFYNRIFKCYSCLVFILVFHICSTGWHIQNGIHGAWKLKRSEVKWIRHMLRRIVVDGAEQPWWINDIFPN